MQTLGVHPLTEREAWPPSVTGAPVVTTEAGPSERGIIAVAHGLIEPESEGHFQQPLGVQEENMSWLTTTESPRNLN